ncbi:GNAT family N-acetyltransferase [Azohydromonas sp.]|uniref:GNAT family N-acetyltransferase n=1 Tax=Azohydromonas sp. TaxID=1872666 RepID=UPI002BC9706C|nr:GNAT family N-acetyltransferase [Azohydromonas sp.]HMM84003.1 GNAT family N-acetyltransferase [Azohydromonas sp.]
MTPDVVDRIVPLTPADVGDAMRLSMAAQWNQNEADWRTMLELGEGWGIRLAVDGRTTLAASTVVLPYDGGFAWISMVLVLPAVRRLGLATRLLQHALGVLRLRGLRPVLDATPAGRAVYLQQGFHDTWGFTRYRREAVDAGTAPAAAAPTTRALRDTDWPAVAALDAPAFGANRLPLLRRLAARWPAAARVVEQEGRLRGFVLGRDGREAGQIGPLLADDESTARRLLADALDATAAPVYVDLCDEHAALRPWLRSLGFVAERPFTRMVHAVAGAPPPQAPGRPAPIVLVAGPELG